MNKLFVSGIGTDVGKTVVSAILARAWDMDYWKPVQAGELDRTDSHKVREWTDGQVEVLPERYRLRGAMSPHAAAHRDGVEIQLEDLTPPDHDRPLLIEGAGGLLVSINEGGDSMLDLAERTACEILLVSCHFLGSINQTLLSAELLSNRGVAVRGILFSGEKNEDSERIIRRMTEFPILGNIPKEEPGQAMVERYAGICSFSEPCMKAIFAPLKAAS